jgi:large subunit ribosomal protein L35
VAAKHAQLQHNPCGHIRRKAGRRRYRRRPGSCGPIQESQMPKMKTKSGVKKRFRLTGTGKVISTQANKRHGMIKRTNKQIRQQRGTTIMSESDAKIVRKWMPYG